MPGRDISRPPAFAGSARDLPDLRTSAHRFARAAMLLRPYWGSYVKLAGLGLLVASIGLLGPFFTKILVDGVLPSGSVSLLGIVVGGILVHALFSQLMGTAQSYYGQIVGAHLASDTTVFLVNHVHHLPLRFFERLPVGDILSRLGDLRSSLRSVAGLFDLVFVRGMFVVLIPPILLAMNWRLALVALATLPLTLSVNAVTARALRRRWKHVAESSADLRALNIETLSHPRLLKSMGLERASFWRTVDLAERQRKERLSAARLSTTLGAVNGLVRAGGGLLLTYLGWRMILAGTFTLGGYLAFMAYLGRVQGPLARMTSLFSEFQRTAIMLDRVFELLDEPTEADPAQVYDREHRPLALPFDGGMAIRHLRFHYAMEGFGLEVDERDFPPGSTTVIVGSSGSGKSTLLRLVAGLEEPTAGAIFYGAHPHHSVPRSRIRQSVAVAWQNADLLRGSFRTNIAYGLEDVSDERLEEVVDVCQLRALVSSLPSGLDTPVAEWGASLSGGEQQRIALARALVRETPVLLLDEVTANLDPETEKALLERLIPYVAGKTVVFVSHRNSMIRFGDRVVKMENGRVALVEHLQQGGAPRGSRRPRRPPPPAREVQV